VSRLVDRYDLVIFDLDGVVVLGDRPIDGAPEALARLRESGKTIRFATNNASRRASEVAELLVRLGIQASEGEVLTSAGAAAALLKRELEPHAKVLVVGAPALAEEVAAQGFQVVDSAEANPAAVVQGYGPEVGWRHLAEACLAVRAGARWVATNTDRTLPTPRGALPGNGALVAALSTALDRVPDVVVGKPQPELFLAAARDAGAKRSLVVGDRLDTDIAGARRAGMDSLLVLTGVADERAVSLVSPDDRPTYVAPDLSGLWDVA
jgi:HAD superfamily hydrolase (TIGR01450 family)